MAVKGGASYQPINYGGVPRMARYDIVCIHTIVGYAPAAAAHFSTRADGHQIQSRDTAYQSAANLNGNYRVLAIENEDHGSAFGTWNTGDGHAVPPFTTAQCESNADILTWCHRTHGIPLELVPDSQGSRRGIAYHRQGIKGNWSGYAYPGWTAGEVWSTSNGKVCPGDRRIQQLIEVIIPRARVLAGLDEDMPTAEEIADAVWLKKQPHPHVVGAMVVPKDALMLGNDASQGAEDKVQTLTADVAALTETVEAMAAKIDELVSRPPAQGTFPQPLEVRLVDPS